MPTDAGQAIVQESNVGQDFSKDAVIAPSGLIQDPPRLAIANGPLFEETEDDVFYRRAQNCGMVPVYWLVTGEKLEDGSDPVVDAEHFHGILAPCVNAQDDGTGGVENFRFTKGRILIAGIGGNPRVATFQARFK